MDLLAYVGDASRELLAAFEEAGGEAGGEAAGGLQINLFWIIVSALNFLLFLAIIYFAGFRRIGAALAERRAKIERGLRDADAARRERERASAERQELIAAARREASETVARAQRSAEELREQELAATRAEIERVREQALNEIAAERQRAVAEVRAQVADLALAAAGRVVGETMTGPRERRLVEEFLQQVGAADGRTGPTGA